MKYYLRLGLTLTIVCAVAAAGLGVTYSVTKGTIEKQIIKKEQDAAKIAFPDASDFPKKDYDKKLKNKYGVEGVFTAKSGAGDVGFVLKMSSKGYGGPMTMMIGISKSGEVAGVSIVEQRETPGLGSKIEDEDFIGQFKNKKVSDPVEVKDDINAITAATISSKAATKAVRDALDAFEEINE